MRHIAIGDIHGCFDALSTLIEKIPIEDEDMIVTLGDHVDRGPRSREVLEWLIARESAGRLVALKGNHELMMIDAANGIDGALAGWKWSGGDATLRSYSRKKKKPSIDVIPAAHMTFIRETCRDYFETDTHFFVHANAYAQRPLSEQHETMLFWEKFHNTPEPHMSGKTMICGHTPQKSGRPRHLGHATCIDTGAYKGGWLTALNAATGEYWQANEKRSFRGANLSEPDA